MALVTFDLRRNLAENGLNEDLYSPYTYYVPMWLEFDCGRGNLKVRSLWAIVMMARASGSRAFWLDCDREGYPELPQFTGGVEGFHRVKITDPFAQELDMAMKENLQKNYREGNLRFISKSTPLKSRKDV